MLEEVLTAAEYGRSSLPPRSRLGPSNFLNKARENQMLKKQLEEEAKQEKDKNFAMRRMELHNQMEEAKQRRREEYLANKDKEQAKKDAAKEKER